MTDRRFEYDNDLLQSCATSAVASFVANGCTTTITNNNDDRQFHNNQDNDERCIHLFNLHASHYGRVHDKKDQKMLLIENTTNDGTTKYSYQVGKTLQIFIKNVIYVHNHNNQENNQENNTFHRVALNRFSDMESPIIDNEADIKVESVEWNRFANSNLNKNRMLKNVMEDDERQDLQLDDTQLSFISPLDNAHGIINAAIDVMGIGKGSMHHLHKHKPKKYYDNDNNNNPTSITYDVYPTNIEIPTNENIDSNEHFETPTLETDMDGTLLKIRKNKNIHMVNSNVDNDDDDDTTATTINDDPYNINDNTDFQRHLNWATSENPDGVPLVHPPFDQGTCGSCWAASATGTVEASAARREAYRAYKSYMYKHKGVVTKHKNYDDHNWNGNSNVTAAHIDNAIEIAKDVERSAFAELNLSIQELIDCDTSADQGCTGGNPLLSFYYIHRYGLTSWEQYPYTGEQSTCKKRLARHPIATTRSWGVISPNHEDNMELALRYIGPIAVGFNGADPSFISYSGGIFDRPHCRQSANHALLLVGYGEEIINDVFGIPQKRDRYWIARNSWGTGWGEGGYVRIRRGNGKKGTPGVCGVARSPSVALGGILLNKDETFHGLRGGDFAGEDGSANNYSPLENAVGYTVTEKICLGLHLRLDGNCGVVADWIDNHKAQSLGMFGIFIALLAVWPLTLDCRRRRYHRRMRRQRQLSESQKLEEAERTALITAVKAEVEKENGKGGTTYGAIDGANENK